MSQIKQFELVGVGSDVQFGKGGNKLKSLTGAMSLYLADDSTLANLFVAEPTLASHAATKNYVDNAIQGLNIKQSVLVGSTADIDLTTGGLLTIDGVLLTNNDRVLVKDQTDPTENGIYLAHSGAWTRSLDADTGTELLAAFVFVEEGTTNDNTGWVVTTNPPIVIGTSNIYWAQFSGAGSYLAGSGLTLTGNTFSANTDGVTTYVDGSNNVAVKSSATQYQTLISNGLSTTPTWGALDLSQAAAVTGTLPVNHGGTGIATAATNGIVFGNGTSPLGVTAAGSQYQILRAGAGGTPAFGSIDLSQSAAVGASVLALANGGTNAALTASAGSVAYSTASAIALTAAGTSGQILKSNGTSAPTFVDVSTVAITSIANEGSGTGAIYDTTVAGQAKLRKLIAASNKLVINTDSFSVGDVDLDVVESNLTLDNIGGTLSVTKGGTGNITIAADQIFYGSATDTLSTTTLTSFARSLLADSTALAARSTLGLVIGTNVQAWDAGLDSLAALPGTGFIYQTAANTFVDGSITVDGAGNLAGLFIDNTSPANPVLGLDIQGLADSGAMDSSLEFAVYNGTANANRKLSVAELKSYIQSDAITDPLTVQGLNIDGLAGPGDVTFGNPIGYTGAWFQALVSRVVVYVATALDAGVNMQVKDGNGNILADTMDTDLQNPGTYIIDLNGLPAGFGGFNSVSANPCKVTFSGSTDTSGNFVQVAIMYNLTM